MNMKKIALLLSALLVLSLVLCACSGSDSGGDQSSGTEATAVGQEQTVPVTSTPAADDGKVTYTVIVMDEVGNPVSGVKLQFCDAESCRIPVTTGADGKVTQNYVASEYHITLTSIPEGYSSEETEFYFDGETELTVVLTAGSEQ